MNLVKRSLVEKRTKSGIRAFGEVKILIEASLLSILDFLTKFWPASSSYFSVKSARK